MKRSITLLAVLALFCPRLALAGSPFELLDGDRVVLIGGTMIERDQEHGYLETLLTRRYPDRSITFRNLGWSGDTVEGISRARFGPPEEGFQHLVEHVLALQPTVILVGYGANEAFEGPAGIPKFLKGLDRLLKAIEPTRARLVFLAPSYQEDLGPPLPNPDRHNADLAIYRDALKAEAEKRGAVFVDLFQLVTDQAKATPRKPLTDNGIHLTAHGYWQVASAIEGALFPVGKKLETSVSVVGWDYWCNFATKTKLEKAPEGSGVRIKFLDDFLPAPLDPDSGPERPENDRVIKTKSHTMPPGRHTLKIDGKPVATADKAEWARGVTIRQGPEFDQSEALRKAIVAKNQLYFYRWRPQNETYLFGFRKHEQGRNAREIVEFDPLIAAKEAEIAKLRVPVPHLYQFVQEAEKARPGR